MNIGRHKTDSKNDALVGKGTAKEIALQTIEFANLQNIKLLDLTPEQFYNFQKKNHLGIDCSGLVCQLFNSVFKTKLDSRHTSAQMLTSKPLATRIKRSDAKEGDLIRQRYGKHVLLVLSIDKKTVTYINASSTQKKVMIDTKPFSEIPNQGFWRVYLTSVGIS